MQIANWEFHLILFVKTFIRKFQCNISEKTKITKIQLHVSFNFKFKFILDENDAWIVAIADMQIGNFALSLQ